MSRPKPGAKRLFSNRGSTLQLEAQRYGDLDDENKLPSLTAPEDKASSQKSRHLPTEDDANLVSQSEKRSRTSDWPLKNTNERCDAAPRPPLRTRHNLPNSPTLSKSTHSQLRPSKFVEGSMNDRASQRPDPSYICDAEEARELFEANHSIRWTDCRIKNLGALPHHANQSVVPTTGGDRSESSRSSTIFRLGKSLAAAFNPATWKIWSKVQDGEDVQEMLLAERREKAEEAYKELNGRGQLRTSTDTQLKAIHTNKGAHSKHDSAVVLGHRASIDSVLGSAFSNPVDTCKVEKRYGKIFLDSPDIQSLQSNESILFTRPTSLTKSRIQFRKPSLPNIYMAHGDPKLVSPTDGFLGSDRGMRRMPSRKELQKQQKLVKRVSDLESKLEATRNQLAEALGEPLSVQMSAIGRSQFTPGTLTSLPSERLLSAHTPSKLEYDRLQTFTPTDNALPADACDAGSAVEIIGDICYDQEILPKNPATPRYGKPSPEPRLLRKRHNVQSTELKMAGERTRNQDPQNGDKHAPFNTSRTISKKRKSIGVNEQMMR